jgi:hypothetical protein
MKIAAALKSELKNRKSRAKLVAGWTGANERMAKNWILRRYAPCDRHLVGLAQHSEQVLRTILTMAGRQDCCSPVKWIRSEGCFEPIVALDDFLAVRKIISERRVDGL